MRKGGGHAKGAGFEREIAKKLSTWMTNGERDDLLWRTAMSGGRATLQRRRGKKNISQVGDLAAIDPAGNWLTDRFVVELKHVRSLDLASGWVKGQGKFAAFWCKLCSEAFHAEREPLLIARENRFPTLLITTNAGLALFDVDRELLLFNYGTAVANGRPFSVMLFDRLLTLRPPQ